MQNIPQVIMGGLNLGAMSRDELKAHVIGLDPASHVHDAQVVVSFLVDGRRRDAEQDLKPLEFDSFEDEMDWRECLRDEGLSEEDIDLIAAGQPVPHLGKNWQPVRLLMAEGRW